MSAGVGSEQLARERRRDQEYRHLGFLQSRRSIVVEQIYIINVVRALTITFRVVFSYLPQHDQPANRGRSPLLAEA